MADKKLAGKKVLMVIAPDQFRDEELLEPKQALINEGAHVVVACRSLLEAKGMLGAKVKPDMHLKDVKSQDFDGVTVVGGMGSPTYLWEDKDLHKLLQEMHKANKVVSGICLSGAVLARAGVLTEKNATVWPMPESIKALEEGKAHYQKQPVVQDGNIITAVGPDAVKEFGQAIVNGLSRQTAKV
ncbi:MAG: DJ-1/PfpI family protein [Candidatus Melainabacteria bacterium]|nr:DJ-1/PfpI family protein [Candidatus Melainabacteria bacterium]